MKLQDKLQEIRDKFVPCNCDEAYKSRGLTAPDCPQCFTDVEEAMIAFAKYCCELQRQSDAEKATITPLSGIGFINFSQKMVDKNSILNAPLITDEL